MLVLKKVISGGQVGVDISALLVAKRYGLETGGWMPKGFLTQAGPKPEWAERYGLTEHDSSKYPARTYANVKDSDATLRIAGDFNSAGEVCTLKAINQYKKPHIDVDVTANVVRPIHEIVSFLERYKVQTLNVAGNTENTFSGIGGEAIDYLARLFEELGFKEVESK